MGESLTCCDGRIGVLPWVAPQSPQNPLRSTRWVLPNARSGQPHNGESRTHKCLVAPVIIDSFRRVLLAVDFDDQQLSGTGYGYEIDPKPGICEVAARCKCLEADLRGDRNSDVGLSRLLKEGGVEEPFFGGIEYLLTEVNGTS